MGHVISKELGCAHIMGTAKENSAARPDSIATLLYLLSSCAPQVAGAFEGPLRGRGGHSPQTRVRT